VNELTCELNSFELTRPQHWLVHSPSLPGLICSNLSHCWITDKLDKSAVAISYLSQIKLLRLLDHVHATVYLSSSLTARQLSPSRNISRLIYSAYLFRAWIMLLTVEATL